MITNNSTLRRTIVGTVTDTGTVDISYVAALSESIKVGLMRNVVLIPILYRSGGDSTMRLNQLITLAWREGVDDLIFVSPEASWEPTAMVDVAMSPKQALALPTFGAEGFRVQMGEVPRLQTDENTGEVKVMSASLDFLKLGKEVLGALCETHPTAQYEGGEVKLVLEGGDMGASHANASDILAARLREAQYELWLNPAHTVQTVVRQVTQADFASALREAKGE